MPILRIDLFSTETVARLVPLAGRRYFPPDGCWHNEIELRWCGQCRLQDECGIRARVHMILELNGHDYHTIQSEAIIAQNYPEDVDQHHDVRPKEWVHRDDGQPHCTSMQVIGGEIDTLRGTATGGNVK